MGAYSVALLLAVAYCAGRLRRQPVFAEADDNFADGMAMVGDVSKFLDANVAAEKPDSETHADAAHTGGWTYEDTEAWEKQYAECGGDKQSPIDLRVGDLQKGGDQFLAWKYQGVAGRFIENNGHSLQVNGNFGSLSLPDGEYRVAQFHFHFPSEHRVDGSLSAGEIHIVHQRVGATGTNDLAVVSILLEEVSERSASNSKELSFLTKLGFNSLSLPRPGKARSTGDFVDLGSAFSRQLSGHYMHYKGSLTTPPCSESVQWFVLQLKGAVTPAMIQHFHDVVPENNRPVQELNDRIVVDTQVAVEDE
jgi:carbonic anhydrase